jgi:hypothetical protein
MACWWRNAASGGYSTSGIAGGKIAIDNRPSSIDN